MSQRWRGVLAALLNPELRAALAELEPRSPLTDGRRARALERLQHLGLVVRDGDGVPRFADSGIRELLAEAASPRPTGPERFLDAAGRIDRYPVRAAEQHELLAWIAVRALSPGEVLDEAALNGRLEAFTSDVAVLRRHLVDHELLERTRSGSEYALVTPPPG